MAKDKGQAPAADTATQTTPATPPAPAISTEQRAAILADKQAKGTLGRPWKMKGGSDIPVRFDGNEATQYESADAETVEGIMSNMMAFCAGGTDLDKARAVQDKFNGAHRLEGQKRAKDLMKANPSSTLADIQDALNEHLSGGARKSGGGVKAGAAKARAEKAEAKAAETQQAANDILAELEAVNPEAAARYRERLAKLGA